MLRLIGIGAAAMLAGAASPAPAQPSPDTPWTAEGRLEDGDSVDPDGEHRFDDFGFRLEAGRRYRISASSDDFDTLIRLFHAGSSDPAAENDDAGGSLDSQLVFVPPRTDSYVLHVTSFTADGRGAYAARIEMLPPLRPPVSTPGTPVAASGTWSLWQGELGPADPDEDGRHYDDYLVRLEAGRTHWISLEAPGFDPVVQVLQAAGGTADPAAPVDGDDDAGVGFNALLAFTVEETGDYVVRVASYEQGESGAYRLWISR